LGESRGGQTHDEACQQGDDYSSFHSRLQKMGSCDQISVAQSVGAVNKQPPITAPDRTADQSIIENEESMA
jgi:hypothetical protein